MKTLAAATLGTILILWGTNSPVRSGTAEFLDVAGPSCLAEGNVVTGVPNNGDYVGSAADNPNLMDLYYVCFEQVSPIDLVFSVTDSGGTTEYVNTYYGVYNFTGSNWVGFKFELGFGTGDNFVPSGLTDQLSFDSPIKTSIPEPISSNFTKLAHGWNKITWLGGMVPPSDGVSSATFQLSIDMPDNLNSFHPNGLSEFTIRLTPLTQLRSP